MPSCEEPGQYRAPKSRQNLRDYHWFCLEHVREYNAHWDFYRGMSAAQIEAELRRDSSWQRPSWPLGRIGSSNWDEVLSDPLHVLASARVRKAEAQRREKDAPPELKEHLLTLGLSWPVTLDAVKIRYKELAKATHPDANGGDRQAEERFKTINIAYTALRSKLREPGLAHAG
jgi:hypothetical protein